MEVSRGTIYLRGNTWTIGYTVGGRRMREAIGSNRQMAEAVLKKRIVECIENRHFSVRNTGRIPFSGVCGQLHGPMHLRSEVGQDRTDSCSVLAALLWKSAYRTDHYSRAPGLASAKTSVLSARER